jgi:ribosomal protein L21E
MIALSTYLKQYKVGDIVDVVANGAVQKGMVCGIDIYVARQGTTD